jgi:hypothetical protein
MVPRDIDGNWLVDQLLILGIDKLGVALEHGKRL